MPNPGLASAHGGMRMYFGHGARLADCSFCGRWVNAASEVLILVTLQTVTLSWLWQAFW